MMVGCTREAPGPACKTAVEKAHAAGIHMKPSVVTETIGLCVQKEWSADARTCVAAASTAPELDACATRFKLEPGGAIHDGAAMSKVMAKMVEFKDQMCACKDMACAQKVSDGMTTWSQEMAKQQDEPPKLTEEETKQATQIGEQLGRCMQKAMGAGAPGDSGNPQPR
jgi:hypothetical protein